MMESFEELHRAGPAAHPRSRPRNDSLIPVMTHRMLGKQQLFTSRVFTICSFIKGAQNTRCIAATCLTYSALTAD